MKTTFTNLLRTALLAVVLTAASTLSLFASTGERLSTSPIASAATAVSADDQLAREDAAMLAGTETKRAFPRLKLSTIEVLGHHTKKYNCIAHSLGVDYWVNPETGDETNPLAKMDAMYGQIGYTRIDAMNTAVEPGLEKVCVYATMNVDASIKEVTHAARQEPDGTWTSKLGSMPLIRHPDLEALRGPVYGTPVAIYVRKATPQPIAKRTTKSSDRNSSQTRGSQSSTTSGERTSTIHKVTRPESSRLSSGLLGNDKSGVLAK